VGIIEIILTVVAWNRGWRWKSLIPMISLLSLAFLMGAAIGLSGGKMTQASARFISILDLICILSLVIMCFKIPNQQITKNKN